MTDTMPTGEEPTPDVEDDPEALADGLSLGIDLSPEEQAAAEEMVAHLEAQFKVEDGTVEEPEAEPEPEVVEEPVAEPEPIPEPEPAAPSSRGVVVVDGVEVPVEEAVGYLARREAQREAQAAAPPAPEPPKPPEWLDQDDPAQVAMWQRQLDLESQIRQIGENQAQAAQRDAVARAQADATSGIATFRALHPELTEDDITTLRTHAVSLDIIDGLARTRTGPDAITKALDIAYWDHPEFRAQATAAPSPAKQKAAERAETKSKLSALSGSSGSVARQEAKPNLSNDREARSAAAQWLREQNILPN